MVLRLRLLVWVPLAPHRGMRDRHRFSHRLTAGRSEDRVYECNPGLTPTWLDPCILCGEGRNSQVRVGSPPPCAQLKQPAPPPSSQDCYGHVCLRAYEKCNRLRIKLLQSIILFSEFHVHREYQIDGCNLKFVYVFNSRAEALATHLTWNT